MQLRKVMYILQNKTKLEKIRKVKKLFVKHMKISNFNMFSYSHFTLNYEVNLTASTVFAIPIDMNGKKIINLCNTSEDCFPPVFLNVFPENGKTVILFLYFKTDRNYYKHSFEQLENSSKRKNYFRKILNYVLVAYPEKYCIWF